MKKKDLPLIIIVVFISAVISLVLSNVIFSAKKTRTLQVEKVDTITDTFPTLVNGDLKGDLAKYINHSSINPTQTIPVGSSANPDPIKDTKQN